MSVIFALLLAAYAGIRIILWSRGRWRLRRLASTLPTGLPPSSAPGYLSGMLRAFYDDSDELRVALGRHRVAIAKTLVTDPDVPWGRVRAFGYRRAVIESRDAIREWTRKRDTASAATMERLETLGVDVREIEGAFDPLREHAHTISRSRALETFSTEDAGRMVQALSTMITCLEATQARLREPGQHPYRPGRDHGAARAVAHA